MDNKTIEMCMKLCDGIEALDKLDDVVETKREYVRLQQFEAAITLRDEEKVLRSSIPNAEFVEDVRRRLKIILDGKIPVDRPSEEQVEHIKKELFYVDRIRLLVCLRDGGYELAKQMIFSEKDEQTLEVLKHLSTEEVMKTLRESEEQLSILQKMM